MFHTFCSKEPIFIESLLADCRAVVNKQATCPTTCGPCRLPFSSPFLPTCHPQNLTSVLFSKHITFNHCRFMISKNLKLSLFQATSALACIADLPDKEKKSVGNFLGGGGEESFKSLGLFLQKENKT